MTTSRGRKAVPGVTRAWAAVEMGIGTMTVRFLMDDLRADDDGWPLQQDIVAVADYIDKMRPVTVKDCFVLAPIKQFIDITILDVMPADDEVKAEIEKNIRDMLFERAAPGATIYAAWISYAIMTAPSVRIVQSGHDRRSRHAVTGAHGGAWHHSLRRNTRAATVSDDDRDRHVRRTGDDYRDAFLTLLPQGPGVAETRARWRAVESLRRAQSILGLRR